MHAFSHGRMPGVTISSGEGEAVRKAVERAGGLVNRTEIGRGLSGGVSNQRVHHLTARGDFPEPLRDFARGPVWIAADIAAWASSHGRPWDISAAMRSD